MSGLRETSAARLRLPSVAILLATYNGSARLREQLDSYLAQTCLPTAIVISDDGSVDGTRQVVEAFIAANPGIEITLHDGPGCGAAANFLSLLQRVPEGTEIIAFSDQDDVWLPQKIERGVQALSEAGQGGGPLLYCGCSWECDEDLGNRQLSRRLKVPAGFRHALVQNVAAGNTMMLNRAALQLVQDASKEVTEVVVHDWWLYQIISGAGGQVIFDAAPHLLYRQHDGNLIGANRGLRAKTKRLIWLLSGGFRRWNTINIRALDASRDRLTPENRQKLDLFATNRDRSVLVRLMMLRRLGLYRQGIQGSLSLYLAALLRRI